MDNVSPLDPKTQKMARSEAIKLLRKIVASKDTTIRFSDHARKELANDNLTSIDAENVLGSPHSRINSEGELENGSFRYRVETSNILVVISFTSFTSLVVVTAWRKKK
jgi:hypothetical protein